MARTQDEVHLKKMYSTDLKNNDSKLVYIQKMFLVKQQLKKTQKNKS